MRKYIPFFIFFFVFLGVNLFKVIYDVRPFFDWDESIYAQVGNEMIQEKSYVVPLWQGKAWLDKPPIPSLMYGLMTYIPVQHEVSMRVLTVLLSGIVLGLLYIFALKNSKSVFVATLTVIITSFLPVFLQRTQSLNVDVFLLIGWLGYFLWYRNLWAGIFFLLFGVLSKSLLGFYPVVMVFLYELLQLIVQGKKRKNNFIVFIQNTLIQLGFSFVWFIWMFFKYKNDFIQYHFIDSHFKRVSASIEQHFGQRTFYIDLLLEQVKYGIIPILVSTATLIYFVLKKKSKEAFFSLIFVPWFLFLNVTKTKIAWYLYPVFPQFVYLSVYMIGLIEKWWVKTLVSAAVLWYFFTYMIPISSYLTTDFSKLDYHQQIAQDAQKAECKDLVVLVNDSTRSSYATLKSMDLTINTTTWWGNHPSMVYYSKSKVTYDYTIQEFINDMVNQKPHICFTAEKEDWDNAWQLRVISKNDLFILGVKR